MKVSKKKAEKKIETVKDKEEDKQSKRLKSKKVERMIKGEVCSVAMEKTVIVKVERLKKHRIYKKYIRRTRRIKAHSNQDVKVGQRVVLKQVKPHSKNVRWELVSILKK